MSGTYVSQNGTGEFEIRPFQIEGVCNVNEGHSHNYDHWIRVLSGSIRVTARQPSKWQVGDSSIYNSREIAEQEAQKKFKNEAELSRNMNKLREDELRAQDRQYEADIVQINAKMDAKKKEFEADKTISIDKKKLLLSQVEGTRQAELDEAKRKEDERKKKLADKKREETEGKLSAKNIEKEILENIIKQVESQLHTFYFVTGSIAIIAGITIVVFAAKSLH